MRSGRNLTTLLAGLALSLWGCGGHDHDDHDHDHDHADHDHAHDGDHEHSADYVAEKGESGEKKQAGPNGGRVVTVVEPAVEFFVTDDRKVRLTFV
ncbi:MAG: hypothetical protein KDM63_00170, partial [Verrucomicrobiae bacterium]|nr:hypothetical protein [Verrucomicrobiae bacterium]